MFSKILVANRGEIAIRVMRALSELGITSVGVYSEPDREALHVHEADEAFLLGAGPAPESYLNVEKIIEAAKQSGAEAIHPGYGFLAENAEFARTCKKEGLVFIGPPAEAIESMGSKTEARRLMEEAGVPIVPGTTKPVASVAAAKKILKETGYPVAFKAAGGGGGKGFRVATGDDDLESAFEGTSREGEKFFSDATVYIEKYLEDPRHIEIQVLADTKGNVIHLGERDCSIQRRHQKLIEETPAPMVDDEMRERIGKIAIDAARAVGYRSAGTVEGLYADGEYYFLEMNTRVQVEHTVTEMATGIDIVREQIHIAAGEPISVTQEDVEIKGCAIECRINAEAAHKNFTPAPGLITHYSEPAGPGVRIDSGVLSGSEITPLYDPMIAKLIVWDRDREAATARMLRALGEFEIEGVNTLIPFHTAILRTDEWHNGETCRQLIADKKWLKSLAPEKPTISESSGDDEEKVERDYAVEVDQRLFKVKVIANANSSTGNPGGVELKRPPRRKRSEGSASAGGDAPAEALVSPIQGTVLRVDVDKDQEVAEGALICVIEAMKMENEITAHRAGKVAELNVSPNGPVNTGDTIAVIN